METIDLSCIAALPLKGLYGCEGHKVMVNCEL